MHRRFVRAGLVLSAGLAVAPAATALPGPTWPLFAAGTVAGGTVAATLTRRIDVAAWLAGTPRILAGIVLPALWLVPAVTTATSVVDLYLSPWFVGVCAVGPWIAAAAFAANCRNAERIDALAESISFSARPPARLRRQLLLAVVTIAALSVAVAAAMLYIEGDIELLTTFAWLPATTPVWLLLLNREGQDVGVTETGLRVQRSIHEWSTFSGYELTDEALVLHRDRWYHSRLAFDRADIDDPDAVVEALGRHLPTV